MRNKLIVFAGTGAVATLTLTGCGEYLAASDVEASIEQDLTEEYSEDEFDVECDDDIDAEVGNQMTCELEWEDDMTETVEVTILDVDEDTSEVEFGFEVTHVDGEPITE